MESYLCVFLIVLILAAVGGLYYYFYVRKAAEYYCTCAGAGVSSDEPVYPLWANAPHFANCSAAEWNAYPPLRSLYGSSGVNAFGWLQNASTPYANVDYDSAATNEPVTIDSQYAVGANEMRDLARDEKDGLLASDRQYSFGAYPYTNVGACADACARRPLSAPRQFVSLDDVPNARLPPGACSCSPDAACSCLRAPVYKC